MPPIEKLFDDDLHEHNLTHSQGAIFSGCRRYRYLLYRSWQAPHPEDNYALACVGLNPSTADAEVDDPTIRRVVDFARRWGYSQLWMLNVAGFRATYPTAMMRELDPIGAHNDEYLRVYTGSADATLCAWGATADQLETGMLVRSWRCVQRPTRCLGRTKSGQPKHPLYVPAATEWEFFNRLPGR